MADRDGLTGNVNPAHYKLELRSLDLHEWTYSGTVDIRAELTAASKSIVIHATQIKLKDAQVLIGGCPIATCTSFNYDDKAQIVELTLDNEVPTTKEVTISISFDGIIGSSLTGFYRAKYSSVATPAASVSRDNDGLYHMLATQFQPNFARKAFPCFDVPNLKATFDFSIEIPSDQVALGNMPVKTTKPSERDGWNLVSFDTTPAMSTYLLAWAVGDLAYVEAFTEHEYAGKQVSVRVYTVRGEEDQGNFAVSIAPKAIDLLSNVFDIPYPLPKMDILAVPEMLMMGMENWGLITAKPLDLLFSEKTSNETCKEGVASNVFHEISHMWFGNLVTMNWWDELWLNEGFATWTCHYVLHHFFPEWNVWARFLSAYMEYAFQADGLRTSHAVHVTVDSSLNVHDIFDNITYNKGCAVIRMIASYVGDEGFLKGVSQYLKNNAYKIANAKVLWRCLEEAAGQDIAAMADSWINITGYPVINVEENTARNEIVVTQSRFLSSGDVELEDDADVWPVPLAIVGVAGGQKAFLNEKQATITDIDMDFYKVNSLGTGFYRVNYPPQRLEKLGKQQDRLTPEDKISIIGSTAALAFSGLGGTSSLLAFLQGFRHEAQLVVWEHIWDILDKVEIVFAENQQIRQGLQLFTLKLLEAKLGEIGGNTAPDDDFLTKSLRSGLQVHAVRCGHIATTDKFEDMLKAWKDHGTEIDPSLRRIAFRAGMKRNPSATFDVLKSEYLKPDCSHGVKPAILGSMGRTDDEEVLQSLAVFNFSTLASGESVASADMIWAILSMGNHPIGKYIQWKYVKTNWADVVAKVGSAALLDRFLQCILGAFSTRAMVADIDDFFQDKDTDSFANTLKKCKDEIQSRASYRERDSEPLKTWLLDNGYIT